MLKNKLDSNTYKGQFIKKMTNFIEKSPIFISFLTTDSFVRITYENTKEKLDFKWDFEKPIKVFIHEIKEELLNHYPRLLEIITKDVKLTADEKAELIINGADPTSLPLTKSVRTETLWRIERVIIKKDNFILANEETDEQFLWKMNSSPVFFLKKYRDGEFKTLESAWEYFRVRSERICKLEIKE